MIVGTQIEAVCVANGGGSSTVTNEFGVRGPDTFGGSGLVVERRNHVVIGPFPSVRQQRPDFKAMSYRLRR